MKELLLVVHMLSAVGIIVFVLLQQGKGADAGAAFGGGGGGASQTLFGARGSANFMSRTTAILAAVFFITSLGLAMIYSRQSSQAGKSITEKTAPAEQTAPPVPVEPQVPAVPK